MCLIPARTPQEAADLTASYFPSPEAAGWTPPATTGGTWCRVSPEGIYEFWPRPQTSCDVVLSDSIKALLGTTSTAG
jgi:hypothetical protein